MDANPWQQLSLWRLLLMGLLEGSGSCCYGQQQLRPGVGAIAISFDSKCFWSIDDTDWKIATENATFDSFFFFLYRCFRCWSSCFCCCCYCHSFLLTHWRWCWSWKRNFHRGDRQIIRLDVLFRKIRVFFLRERERESEERHGWWSSRLKDDRIV